MGQLGLEEIQALLATNTTNGIPRTKQFGPLRTYDQEMRCASRGCGSPTYFMLNGISYCWPHVVWRMNEMLTPEEELQELTNEEREFWKRNGRLFSYEESSV